MNIVIKNGLPVVSLQLTYESNSILLNNVLLDTGCAVSVFDTDTVEEIGLKIIPRLGRAVRMYGIGGQSELSFQQTVKQISIHSISMYDFTLQLGMTKIPYGFDAIIGADFFTRAELTLDFKELIVR